MAIEFIFYLLIVSLFSLLGGVLGLIILKKLRFKKYNKYALLAALFLTIIIISELMKEGFAVTGYITLSLVAGAGFSYLLNKIVKHQHENKSGILSKRVFRAMMMHELPKAIALGSSFAIASDLGKAIAILLALYNIPQGGLFALPYLMKEKVNLAFKALGKTQIAFIIVSLASYFVLLNFSIEIRAFLMTFAAGMILFVVIEEGLLLKK